MEFNFGIISKAFLDGKKFFYNRYFEIFILYLTNSSLLSMV